MITLYDADQKTVLATIQNKQVTIHNTTEDFPGIDSYEVRQYYPTTSTRLSHLNTECRIDSDKAKLNFFDKINDNEYFLFETILGFYNSLAAATHSVNVAMGR